MGLKGYFLIAKGFKIWQTPKIEIFIFEYTSWEMKPISLFYLMTFIQEYTETLYSRNSISLQKKSINPEQSKLLIAPSVGPIWAGAFEQLAMSSNLECFMVWPKRPLSTGVTLTPIKENGFKYRKGLERTKQKGTFDFSKSLIKTPSGDLM